MGNGNCQPELPQWWSQNSSDEACAAVCAAAELCVGYDWSPIPPAPSSAGECRARFPYEPAVSPPAGYEYVSPDGGWQCSNITTTGSAGGPICWVRDAQPVIACPTPVPTPAPSPIPTSPKAPPGSLPCLRVLFVGNSYTYGLSGPQRELNNLPLFFKLVAKSLGRCVDVGEDTIGGCTLYAHRPSLNPDGCAPCDCGKSACPAGSDPTRCFVEPWRAQCSCSCELVVRRGLDARDGCTVANLDNVSSVGLDPWSKACPQLLHRRRWDVVVLQDFSTLPTVKAGRRVYMEPAVAEYAAHARATGAKVAMYMTWANYNGSNRNPQHSSCPGGSCAPGTCGGGCWPHGGLSYLSKKDPNSSCHAWALGTRGFECEQYALARGYADALRYGADILVPCGAAWLTARGSAPIPAQCRAAVDAEYDPAEPSPLPPLPLPGNASGVWAGAAGQRLFHWTGWGSKFCADGCEIDGHPSVLGMYLNALVFYATLFEESPVGAAIPAGQVIDGEQLSGNGTDPHGEGHFIFGDGTNGSVTEEEAGLLQRIAAETVLPHLRWWRPPRATPGPATPRPAPAAPGGGGDDSAPSFPIWACTVIAGAGGVLIGSAATVLLLRRPRGYMPVQTDGEEYSKGRVDD